MSTYDSTADTLLHIKRVNELLLFAAEELLRRAAMHDSSKLVEPEKSVFDEYTPKLRGSTYGSETYTQFLSEMSGALKHHYGVNTHHPEHYENGVAGMDLFDLIEMFFDWQAASERHADGNIMDSIRINTSRFGLEPQLVSILENTAKRWVL